MPKFLVQVSFRLLTRFAGGTVIPPMVWGVFF